MKTEGSLMTNKVDLNNHEFDNQIIIQSDDDYFLF